MLKSRSTLSLREESSKISIFMRELIFGLEDGIVSTGGTVVGIAAGTGSSQLVILSGLVVIVVEALSMSAGTYLSSKSVKQVLVNHITQVRQEILNNPEESKLKLRELYRERGFSERECGLLVKIFSSKKEVWLEEMAGRGLGIGRRELTNQQQGSAMVMLVAYAVGGSIPIIPFLVLPIWVAVGTTFLVSLLTLFGIGWWKALVTGTVPVRGGLEMMLVAASAGLLGFLVGRVIGWATGMELSI